MEWERKISENSPQNPRYGHTGILYQKKFFVFGGKIKTYNGHILGDLDIYDLQENIWFQPANFSSKLSLSLRRNHVAELIGHQMLIHGGIGEDNQGLGDCELLSLTSPYKWTPAVITELSVSPILYGHASALVIPSDYRYNPRMNIYKFPDLGFGKMTFNKVKNFFI